MNAFLPLCFLRLLRARHARFGWNWRSAREVRQRVPLNAPGAYYNDLWTRITGRPIRYAKILSTGIIPIGQLTDAVEAIAAQRSAGIAAGQRCAVRPAALDGELPPSSPGALLGPS